MLLLNKISLMSLVLHASHFMASVLLQHFIVFILVYKCHTIDTCQSNVIHLTLHGGFQKKRPLNQLCLHSLQDSIPRELVFEFRLHLMEAHLNSVLFSLFLAGLNK